MNSLQPGQSWWEWLSVRYSLTATQQAQCEQYATLLQAAAATMNLTTLQTTEQIVLYHFADSLELGNAISLETVQRYVDVGTGAGFPGIPLKIAYPLMHATLLEVLAKRRLFLNQVITTLRLASISVQAYDWRTWLRMTEQPVDLVCARASLAPAELLRMFQPSSPYRTARLVYWASEQWQPEAREKRYIQHIHTYAVGERVRKLIIFASVT